jgi:Domain of unknown function (DUF5060)/Domain of unknown function (DUF5605)/Protein of unknown function (DUF4038)
MSNLLSDRRSFLRQATGTATLLTSSFGAAGAADSVGVEQWNFFEITLQGPSSGNPFVEIEFSAELSNSHRTVRVPGFYDGEGTYKVRFMPDILGTWTYKTSSNRTELAGKSGRFECIAAQPGNRGPVQVASTWHFAYADGSTYVPIGTTCYAWTHQGDTLEEQTIETLRSAPFNKLRMCIFPKSYAYNQNEPQFYPFPRNSDGSNNYSRFNPEFFRHLEKRLAQLRDLQIEADLILFHPYDRWGYSNMPPEADDRYLKYVVARLSAFRNVWWSIANEFDLVKTKKLSDWDRYFHVVQQQDPYGHLRSIHHSKTMYDHGKPWVTHVSIQGDSFEKTEELRTGYMKPVIYDECKYEGNIPQRWGNISGQEMVRRFWLGTVTGAYVGHGETYLDSHDVLWWSKGGTLHGDSPKRIAFLRKVLEDGLGEGLDPVSNYYLGAGKPGQYALYYFDLHQPANYTFDLGKNGTFKADLIDPWEMTITPMEGSYKGKFLLKLPGKPYMAVRFKAIA